MNEEFDIVSLREFQEGRTEFEIPSVEFYKEIEEFDKKEEFVIRKDEFFQETMEELALDEKKSKHTHVSLYFAIVAAFAILSLFSSWLGIQDTVTNQLNNISQAVAESIE